MKLIITHISDGESKTKTIYPMSYANVPGFHTFTMVDGNEIMYMKAVTKHFEKTGDTIKMTINWD